MTDPLPTTKAAYDRVILRDRLLFILFRSDFSMVEFMLALCYLIWATSLFLSKDMLSSRPAYQPLIENAPQWAWASVFMTAGVLKMLGVLFLIRWARLAGALVGLFLWVYIITAFWLSHVPPIGFAAYIAFAAVCFLTILRHGRKGKTGREGEHHA